MDSQSESPGSKMSLLAIVIANQGKIISLLEEILEHIERKERPQNPCSGQGSQETYPTSPRSSRSTVRDGKKNPASGAGRSKQKVLYTTLDEVVELRGGILPGDPRELVIAVDRLTPLGFREFIVLKELAKQRLAPTGDSEMERQGFLSADTLADRIDTLMQEYAAKAGAETDDRWFAPTPEDVRKAISSIREKLSGIAPDLIETAEDRGSGYRLRLLATKIKIVRPQDG